MAKQSILKWGNSLGFRLPSEVAKQMKVCEGTEVTYSLNGSQLVIEPAAEQLPPFTKADLARAIRKGKSRADPLGRRKGKEVL
jgi:antitoxin component of MazEF toxin-antitoxin module